jgi:ribonucleoside-triphosphate reductase
VLYSEQTISLSPFQQYIYLSRYSRFLHDENRRETWNETVKRYFDFFQVHLKEKHDYTIPAELRLELETALRTMQAMPSMRCMMTAGTALARDNIAGYNCAYIAIDHPKAFAEILYILMNGTGVGFSVERQYVNRLPEIPDALYPTETIIVVPDSKIGWTKALNELCSLLYTGLIPKWDLSKLRPAGAVLKTFGGRSSGPDPLDRLFKFVVAIFEQHKGTKLDSLAVHDIACMIGETVVVGGVRRSAMISLSNLSDSRMMHAKTGQWWKLTPWRSISNNSAVYTDKQPTMERFMDEWKSLYDSKSGERGIFSRWAAKNTIQRSNEFRKRIFGEDARLRDTEHEWGCNPCSEVLLRDSEFCNLSEVVIRSNDTLETLKYKARIAAIFGTFQSTLTDFKFIGKDWTRNTEDERLLGVSLTGIMDNKLTSGQLGQEKLKECLTELRTVVVATNMEFAKKVGVPASVASTSVKPSGTVSALNDTSSGIHARHSPFYLRTVRSDKKDPLAQLMIDQGMKPENDQARPDSAYVFSFPMKSPKHAITRHDMDAIKQLEIWQIYQMYWTDHKPSVTVSVREHEWMRVGAWVYDHFECMSGVSFLPFSDHAYAQAPFQDLTEDQYKEWMAKTPKDFDWSLLSKYETSTNANLQGAQELACQGVSPDGEVGCVI